MQGKLLIAHPLLNDGFFKRSVIYLTSHSEEGAFGFCLNFKTQFMLRDFRPQVVKGNFPIYEGGPVAKNQLFFLHTLGHNIGDSLQVKDNLFFGGDFNELLHQIEHGKVKSHEVKFFVGYSGWTAGQLENEIDRGHWLLQEPTNADFLRDASAEGLWGAELSQVKSSYGIFAEFSSDPLMN